MDSAKLFSNHNLNNAKKKVWHEAVIPYILRKNTNFAQKTLIWIAEHTLAGAAIGVLSIGAIGVFAWENSKDVVSYPSLTEVVFNKDLTKSENINQNTKEKVYTKGTFQPIVVENDKSIQPLDQITSGSQHKK